MTASCKLGFISLLTFGVGLKIPECVERFAWYHDKQIFAQAMAPTSARQLALSNLSLPTDTYIFSLASSRSQCTVISSDDSLRYFDPSTLKVLQSVARAHDGVTCLCSNSSDGSNVGDFVTAGRDGLVRSWDSRGKRANWELRDREYQNISYR